MLVVFDGRATLAPTWLETSGFTLWEGVEIAGAEYRIPYVYKVSSLPHYLESPIVPSAATLGRFFSASPSL